ncbi:hypothetical protein LY474_36225 [Myxococcus stipitatus]|uniref:hypothetical protein n=1 Tax=Myxococcus stipitatus TaxID=83455 RepID=UPI001F35B72D|nr:hypothetical protein [Myxococcus stipitatus]MCE9673269.1 hypothetical protein [Myxococcus stipitatus]
MRSLPSSWQRCVATLVLGLSLVAGCSGGGEKPPPGGPDGGGSPDGGGGPGPSGCLGEEFLTSLERDHLLVGAQMEDGTARSAPFDVHYLYIAGGLFDSNDACGSCRNNCTSNGASCALGGCAWWGCWQDTTEAPGEYVRGFASRATERGQIPFITYYQHLLGSGVGEGQPQLGALDDLAVMRRYLADWRFTLKQVGTSRALLHIEPDLWGYLQFFSNGDPRSVAARVASANGTDCAGFDDNAAGLARCMVAMARKYAPNAKVGLHASPWATKQDVYLNTQASFDVVGEANKVADFLLALGAADTDFVVVEASDRDAGYYDSIGEDTWWDANNTRLPHFRQAFTWARALSERMRKPNFWWQLPVGNMSLPNNDQHWRDNRVDYFFAHTAEVAAAHAVGFSFGAGEGQQTTPETDNGNLVNRVRLYDETGGQPACVH